MGRRRIAAIVGLLCVASVSAAGLAATLVAGTPGNAASAATAARAVNADEAGRLAVARLANFRDGQASFAAEINSPHGDVHLAGWVDWVRPLIYLNSTGQGGAADGLVQAVPGVVAVHAGRYQGDGGTDGYPPLTPPADGWRVRQMDPNGGGASFDALLTLLFSLAAPTADDPATILAEATTIRPAQLAGGTVDVYTGRAFEPVAGISPAPTTPQVTGAVQYWLDGTGRMRRVIANLGTNLPVRLDLAPAAKQPLVTVPMLGGAPVTPRALTDAELTLVSRVRLRDRNSGGGTVALTLPVNPTGLTTATGWLDWRASVGYLALHNPDDASQDQLLRVEHTGLATRDGAPGVEPPLQPPTDGWHFSAWSTRGDAGGASDLDILLTQAVTMTNTRADDLADLRAHAAYLRADSLAGVPVTVIEIRQQSEGAVAGTGRVRYWLDATGLLRRIEVRTRQGGYGWLDISPATVPRLPDPHTT